jgi:hypothetical protein
MLTRRNYEQIADMLARAASNADKLWTKRGEKMAAKATVGHVTIMLAEYFAVDNPAFDRKKFYEAVIGTDNDKGASHG